MTRCFITRWNTSNFVKNTRLHVLFSALFSVFHLVMKHCISCLIYYIKKSSDWPNRSVICYISFIFHHPVFKLKYSRLPITWTFQGNLKKFESVGVWVIGSMKQITRKEEMGWGMNASNMQNLINTQCWTLLYSNWTDKKSKDKEQMVVKIISMFQTVVHIFPLVRCLKHGLSYWGYS